MAGEADSEGEDEEMEVSQEKGRRRMLLPAPSRRSRAQQTRRSARPPRPGTRKTTRRRRPSLVPPSRVPPRLALLNEVTHDSHSAVQYSGLIPLKSLFVMDYDTLIINIYL